MTERRENLVPLTEGPRQYDEQQITPTDLIDMQLGYLSNLGARVELVIAAIGRVDPVTIVAVGRTYLRGEEPEADRIVSQQEIDENLTWVNCDYVTFYKTHTVRGVPTYEYNRLPYHDLGLAPVRDRMQQPTGWEPRPVWYLRWPDGVLESPRS